MYKPLLMHEGKGVAQTHHPSGHLIWPARFITFFRIQPGLMQAAVGAIFHDQSKALGMPKVMKKGNDSGMVQTSQRAHFCKEALLLRRRRFFQELDRNLAIPQQRVPCQPHFAETTLPKGLPHPVLVVKDRTWRDG